MKYLILIAALLVLADPSFADDFDNLADNIESQYHVNRLNRGILGMTATLTKPFLWFKGIKEYKMVIFREDDLPIVSSSDKLDSVVSRSLDQEWKPFIRIDSRRKNSSAVMYSQFNGTHMRLLITSIEDNTISITHIKMSGKAIGSLSDDLGEIAKKIKQIR